MTNQRKLSLLLGLLVLWGILIVLEAGDESSSPRDSSGSLTQRSDSGVSTREIHAPPIVTMLSPIENPKGRVTLAKPRNVFAPLRWETPRSTARARASQTPKPKPQPIQQTAKTQAQPVQPEGPSPSELAAQRARQQLRQYRFLGYLTKGGVSQAFLTNGQAIYIVKQGERMDGRIHVRKIEPTTVTLSMTIGETGDQVEASIPLVVDQSG